MRRTATILAWSSALCGVLAAWLFLPGTGDAPERPRLRAVLVDASASAARARAWLPWARAELRAEARAARDAGEELAVVAFAEGVATLFPSGEAGAFLERLDGAAGAPFDPAAGLATGATRLAEALRSLEPVLCDPARPPGTLVLLAPPGYTGESPELPLSRLRAAGVTIDARPPPRAEAGDLGVLELALAPRVEPGAPLVARARLVFRRGTLPADRASLALEVEGALGPRSLVRELELPGADGELELALDCGPAEPGRNEVRLLCRLSTEPDLVPENDLARATTVAGDTLTIGVVADGDEDQALARAWLAPPGREPLSGLALRFLAPREVARELDGLSALVTLDVAPRELPAPLLASFVRRGGGWLALSGWRLLSDWIPGVAPGPLLELLPCEPAGPEAPPRDVVLLVDGSGSMEGEPFDSVRAAALELVASALPSDRVSLRFFTTGLEREHVLRERSARGAQDPRPARDAARALLALRVPRGSTFLLRSLEELAAGAGEHETLALLLSDGWDREGASDEVRTGERVRERLDGARVRLVVIGVGDPNQALLSALAGGAEHVRSGRTLGDLRAVFQRELHRPRLAEGEIVLRAVPPAQGSLAAEIAAGTPRPVARHLRNRLRPGAEALWESPAGEPVLAVARAGLGRTALLASRPGAGWADGMVGEGPAGFEGLLRWLARGPERAATPRARIEGGRLTVTGLSPSAPPVLSARLLDGTGTGESGVEGERLTLRPPAELGSDALGTRTAEVRAWGAQPVLGLDSADEQAGELVLAVELALPDELAWRERTVPEDWLAPGEAAPARPRGARGSHPAAPWAVALALALLLGAGLASNWGQGRRAFVR